MQLKDKVIGKKVVLLLRSLRGRGLERSYLDIAKMFEERGCEVHLILREEEIVLDISSVSHLHILEGMDLAQKATALRTLLQKIGQKTPIDLILSSNVSLWEKSGLSHPNIYFSVNMSWGYRLLKRLRFIKYLKVQREYRGKKIIAVSQGVKEDLLKLLRIKPASIDVIYDPYDVVEILQMASKKIVSMKRGQEYIVCVGAFDKIKRHDILIRAFARLKEPIDLVLIGIGKEQERMKKLVRELGLVERVHFLGWVENPYPYIKEAKLTVLSSESEALPRVLIESLIVGTTVVSTDCKFGPLEIVGRDKKAYLAKVNDPKDLANKISFALQNPMKIVPDMYEKYTKEKVINRYCALVE